jgi:hypothetical protein
MSGDEPTGPTTPFEGMGLDAVAGDVPADMLAESEWIFTFGYGHTHPVTGAPLDDHFARVRAVDYHAARARIVKHFGVRWAFQYPAGELDLGKLYELPESEWPPPIEREVKVVANHTILRSHELRAACFVPLLESVYQDAFMLRAVLVSGEIGDYAVYLGIGPDEWVADHGVKVTFAVANGFFPGLEERLYRP